MKRIGAVKTLMYTIDMSSVHCRAFRDTLVITRYVLGKLLQPI